ncbi:MAG TPA: trypsin-like peptidase domain-containing protein [Streptosporangiales bacterium]
MSTTQHMPPTPGSHYHEVPPPLPPQPVAPPPSPRRGPRTAGVVALVLAAGLVGGGVGAGATYGLTSTGGPTTVSSLPSRHGKVKAPTSDVTAVADKVLPSVVSIVVTTGNGGDEGTGIIVSSSGEILTNNHVVSAAKQGAGQIEVSFRNGRTASARILGTDPTSDLAVIKVDGVSGLQPASLGDSTSLQVGDPVVAIGSPLGLSGTVTSGIVSALNRPVRTSDSGGGGNPFGGGSESNSAVLDAIQTDAAINPGNSGGPLVDMNGRVIGINSAIASVGDQSTGSQSGNIGVGFAIPISEAWPIAQELIKDGSAKHALLGVQVTDAGSSNGVTDGAKLAGVTSGGPADKAGLQSGDVVTKVDGRSVDSADGLVAAVRSRRPGDSVTVTYERGGTTHTAKVTLGSDR